jgi:hypothetical protein
MRNFLILALLAILLGSTSCNDELDLNAEYQDITIVYGLLDQDEDTTYLKINKAFLGDGNVLEMAKVQDSSIYKTDLSATIEAHDDGNFIAAYPFDQTEIDNKDTGTFYNPYQIIYFSPFEINEEYTYKLIVQVNNKTITSETPIVEKFSIKFPSAGAAFVRINYGNDYAVEWTSATNGKRYETVIRFNFRELFLGTTDTIPRYIDWFLGTNKSANDDGGETLEQPYLGDAFYAWLSQFVPYDDQEVENQVKARFSLNLEYIIMVAAEDFNTYLEVNEPSSSIVQERPEFSNVDNGLGLFSSRLKQSRVKKIHPETIFEIQQLEPSLKFEY